MPPCTLRDSSLWLKLDQGVLRTRTRSFRAPKRGGPCFLLVPQQRARPPGKESSGWLRGWDRSIKCTDDAPSTNSDANLRASDVSDRLHDDGASAHSPQGGVTPSTHATRKRKKAGSSAGRSAGRSHHDPRSDFSGAVCFCWPHAVLASHPYLRHNSSTRCRINCFEKLVVFRGSQGR